MNPNMPDWMRNCEDCSERLKALRESREDSPLGEFEEVRAHLVDAHLALLPGYFGDCANCQEWVALLEGDTSGLMAASVLKREALLHRAGHLLT